MTHAPKRAEPRAAGGGDAPLQRGSQSFRTFSNRLPPRRPTGISTQNRAAVPKISEAMGESVELLPI